MKNKLQLCSEEMVVRKAKRSELDEIMGIYASARIFMKAHGNPFQWGDNRPERAVIEKDLEAGHLYVCTLRDKIGCVMSFAVTEEPTYAVIDGKWLNEKPYGVIHRIASNGTGKGMAAHCIAWAYEKQPNIRIDTHADNIPMQSLLKKLGFTCCGIIRVADGTKRLAYQKTL